MGVRVTLPDRCLLYLAEGADVSPGDATAEDRTQGPIAVALRAQRAHVSRAMKRLGSRGLVREAMVRVRTGRRRRRGYFLTDEGRKRALAVRSRVEEIRVTVVDEKGLESTRRLYEVARLLPRRLPMAELAAAIEGGRLDLRPLQERALVHRGRVYDVRGAVSVPHFRGRMAVLARLDAFAADPSARGFLLLGLPGIGKTALASRWAASRRARDHVVWRRLGPGTTEAELLRDLARALHAAGRPALWSRLHRPTEGALGGERRLLERELAGLPVLLVFDDAHAASPESASVVEAILRSEGAPGPKVLVLSRTPPTFVTSEDQARGRIWREAIDDLPAEDAHALLAAMGVDPGRRDRILARCGGHPMSLELAARGRLSLESIRRASAGWLAEAALTLLDARDRDALALAATFQDTVPSELLGASAGRLVDRCLLREASEGRVGVHDLVREAALKDLSPARIAQLHRRAGASLAESRDPRDLVDALRHFLAAASFREAVALAEAHATEAIEGGLAAPIVPLLDKLARASREAEAGPRMHLLMGHALSALGRWRDASAAYEGCERASDPRVVAEGALGRGKAAFQRRSRLAFSLLLAAREKLERIGALRSLAEAQYWLGCALENSASPDEAAESFERGRAIAIDVGDRQWEGMCTYGVGRIRSHRGDYRGAVDTETEALRLLEREGGRLDIAKVCVGLGGNLYELDRLKEADALLARGAAEARAAGATGILAVALYNQGAVRGKARRFSDALPLLEEAEQLHVEQEQVDNAVGCAAWLGAYAALAGAPEVSASAFRRAESMLARVRDPGLRVRAMRELADAEGKVGRVAPARRRFDRAIRMARAIGWREYAKLLSSLRSALPTRSHKSPARTSRTRARPGTRTRRGTHTGSRTQAR